MPSALPQRSLTKLSSILFTVLVTLAVGCDGSSDGGGTNPPAVDNVPSATCDQDVFMSMDITGMVHDPRGRPHIGHVVLRDRAIRVGSILAEASANEAGFFLLNADGVVTAPGCKMQYVIEVDSSGAGAELYGELDVTSLFPVGGTGKTEEDITDTPVVLAVVE